MTLIEAAKQALEALEEAHPKPYNESVISHVEAITVLRAAIEAAEKQGPVAFNRKAVWNVLFEVWNQNISASEGLQKLQDLYTTPPAAQPAPVQKLLDPPAPWHHRILKAHPFSEPEYWPDSLRLKYVTEELQEYRAAFTPPAAQQDTGLQDLNKMLADYVKQIRAAQRQPLTDEEYKALVDARNEAMQWAIKGRIPECGAFAGIAQNLDYLCEQLSMEAKLKEKNT
jgi:hypothetical protein